MITVLKLNYYNCIKFKVSVEYKKINLNINYVHYLHVFDNNFPNYITGSSIDQIKLTVSATGNNGSMEKHHLHPPTAPYPKQKIVLQQQIQQQQPQIFSKPHPRVCVNEGGQEISSFSKPVKDQIAPSVDNDNDAKRKEVHVMENDEEEEDSLASL